MPETVCAKDRLCQRPFVPETVCARDSLCQRHFVPETQGLRENDGFIAIPRSLLSPRSSVNLSVYAGSLSTPTQE